MTAQRGEPPLPWGCRDAYDAPAAMSTEPPPLRVHWTPAASGSRRCLGGFLQVLDVDAAQAAAHAGAFDELRHGTLQAVVLHGVCTPAAARAALARLEAHDPPFLRTSFPAPFRSWFYGRNISLAHPQLEGYFEEAALFTAQLAELASGHGPLLPRLMTLLSALDNGRPFAAAPGPAAGLHYMPTTLRAHESGGFIPPHFDNEMRLRPSYRHLETLLDPAIQSFVLTLDPGEAGGALEIFDLRCDPEAARLHNDDRGAPLPDLEQAASVSFRLPPGATVLVDSGRLLHRVTPVQGKRRRWTACSFMARERGRTITRVWG